MQDRTFQSTPNITHLYLDKYKLITGPEQPPGWDALLQKLQSLVIGADVVTSEGIPFESWRFPPLPSTIKMIDILSPDVLLARGLLLPASYPDAPGTPEEDPQFRHLESFRCQAPLEPQEILRVVSAATDLQTFEISSLEDPAGPNMVDAYALPEALAARVHTAGLHKFCWQNRHSYHDQYTGQPFVDWLAASFPNVETVSAYPQRYPNAELVIFSLIKSGKYKTIYQCCLAGAARDEALALAKEKGVNVIHTAESFRPPMFPWPEGRYI